MKKLLPRSGFTLVELMIVVVIIGLLAAIAIPAFQRVSQNARFSTFLNDAHTYAEAGTIYLFETGATAIPDGSSGVLPDELEDYINENQWDQGSSIGGVWDWETGYGFLGVGVHGYTISEDEAALLDERYDDGVADAGVIRRPTGDRIYVVLSP